jgi:hypothetical protein
VAGGWWLVAGGWWLVAEEEGNRQDAKDAKEERRKTLSSWRPWRLGGYFSVSAISH